MASRVPFALLAAIAFGARMDQKLDDSDALNAKLDSLRSDMHAEFKDHMKKLEVEMADERKVLHARLAELDARVAQLETRTASEAATVEEDCADCILNHFAPKEGSQYYQSLCGWMSELPLDLRLETSSGQSEVGDFYWSDSSMLLETCGACKQVKDKVKNPTDFRAYAETADKKFKEKFPTCKPVDKCDSGELLEKIEPEGLCAQCFGKNRPDGVELLQTLNNKNCGGDKKPCEFWHTSKAYYVCGKLRTL